MRFWLAWFGVFLVAECVGLATAKFPTLSEVWRQLVLDLPGGWGLAFAALTGASLLWLLGPHWVWSGSDRPGFDPFELVVLATGALWAALGAKQMRKRDRDGGAS